MKTIWLIFGTALLTSWWAGLHASAEELSRAETAIEVLEQIDQVPEQRIPDWLLRDAEGIVVVPGVVKAGLFVGGHRGRGLMAVKNPEGDWSNPCFITLTGGSIGFQAGVQSSDIVLVFKTRRSVEGLVNGKFTLGGDASVAAGPVGRQATAATDVYLKAEIYAYARSRGLFAGIALDGTKVAIDHEANEAVYGNGATPRRIFAGSVEHVPVAVVDFRDLLEERTAEL